MSHHQTHQHSHSTELFDLRPPSKLTHSHPTAAVLNIPTHSPPPPPLSLLDSDPSAFLNRRQPYPEPRTPNLFVHSQELFSSPPPPVSQPLEDHHQHLPAHRPRARLRIGLPAPFAFLRSSASSRKPDTHPLLGTSAAPVPSRRLKLHPLALLPAFVLGLLVSYSLHPAISTTPFTLPFVKAHKPLHPVVYRDQVYFPPDYATSSFPISQHPIYQLIQNASLAWEAKLSRQSNSLEEAVQEYVRRYGRRPPIGFDRWYAWCVEKEVVLIDEYDRINEVIEPFWAIPPHRTSAFVFSLAFIPPSLASGSLRQSGSQVMVLFILLVYLYGLINDVG